ncbi:hypothetical protein [Nocardia mangyaensis]|uniref:hypothetical protein n=1 Tax=Nocardia mangyaensis TaxID=2213200 RepID=UPI002675F809|nr:hypothetical protein [Nocardia mangyaensis]MDO3647380.1 hypothetical protein [Nocardia mangyaensis]
MTAYRRAQIARLSVTVVAGAASLCLTFAAGAYIVNNADLIDDTPGPIAPTEDRAAPFTAPRPGQLPPPERSKPVFTAETVELMSSERALPAATRTAVTANQGGIGVTPDDSALGGRVRIGSTYVGAQVAPARTDTLAFTLDTNLVTLAARYLGSTADPAGVTALRTELDTRRGEVMFVLSDPGLGSHTLRVERVQQPATAEPAESAAAEPTEPEQTTVSV